MNTIRLFAVIMLSIGLISKDAMAFIDVPTFRLALGKPMLKITATEGNSATPFFAEGTPVQSSLSLNPMFLWDFPVFRSRIGAHFIMDMGSPYGFLTVTGIGGTFMIYPLGLSSGREKREDDVDFVKTRLSPFVKVAMTPSKVSFSKERDTSSTTPNYFAALILETSIGTGVDYPISDDFISFIGLDYRFASFNSQSVGKVSYSGMAIMLGLMTNFY